jgi:hypothetical protein
MSFFMLGNFEINQLVISYGKLQSHVGLPQDEVYPARRRWMIWQISVHQAQRWRHVRFETPPMICMVNLGMVMDGIYHHQLMAF